MGRGGLTAAELLEWSARRPREVPLLNGEFAFIAARTAEVAEAED